MVVKVEEIRYVNEIRLEERCKICNTVNCFSLPEAKYRDSMDDTYGLVYKCRECGTLNETNHEEYLQYLEKCKLEKIEKIEKESKEVIGK